MEGGKEGGKGGSAISRFIQKQGGRGALERGRDGKGGERGNHAAQCHIAKFSGKLQDEDVFPCLPGFSFLSWHLSCARAIHFMI